MSEMNIDKIEIEVSDFFVSLQSCQWLNINDFFVEILLSKQEEKCNAWIYCVKIVRFCLTLTIFFFIR